MVILMLIENTICNLLPGDNSRGRIQHQHHHGENNHHHQHHGVRNQSTDHQPKEVVNFRKGKSNEGSIDFSKAVLDSESGLKCVMKEENKTMVEDLTPLVTCKHSTISVCYDSYVTMFRAGTREEQCDVYYKKKCKILFNKVARTDTVKQCNNLPQCDNNTVCREVLETVCTSDYDKNTDCERIPRTLCGVRQCQYEKTCHDETVTRVTDEPEESCDLVPTKVCRGVYRTTPYLEPTTQCEDVPK